MLRHTICLIALILISARSTSQDVYHEKYRPQLHFSPQTGWMNDPNGLVFYNGEYHLFFQYYPDSTVWGPMHWGHAISKNLVQWKQTGIALYPDSLGYIFSGSAVVDNNNTSGFGTAGKPVLVAIYTQHDTAGERAKTNHFQNQSIAYSSDAGKTWTKYVGNPVLKTPGLPDFRDPKVMWYAKENKWIMTLAAGDQILFYSSKNLKSWTSESAFGAGIGAHGGVWECPDLIPFTVNDEKIWLLLVNINPGGYQGGSGTQYFTGSFDGKKFTPNDTVTRWADFGPDDYAGVTFSNTGKEKIFLGWMSNWQYGTKVPTVKWRSAMTIPRKLDLKKIGTGYYTTMMPIDQLEKAVIKSENYKRIPEVKEIGISGTNKLQFSVKNLQSFSMIFSNEINQQLTVGYDEEKNAFFIDRTLAGNASFYPGFATIHYAPRLSQTAGSAITMILDHSSLELFADDGLTTMTEIFFPDQPFHFLQAGAGYKPIVDVRISEMRSIWP